MPSASTASKSRIPQSRSCAAQILFALNERYLINEKGALQEAAHLPLTLPHLAERVDEIWRLFGNDALASACDKSREIDWELRALTQSNARRV
ncbi:hypothetical protein ACWAT4_30245 [Bradyrhizobium manausense]